MNRRALLAGATGPFVAALAGCLAETDDERTPGTETTPPPTEPTQSEEPDNRPLSDAVGIGALNRSDEDHTLSVTVRDGDETLLDRTESVRSGVGQSLENDLVTVAGTYSVVAELDAGARLEYDWEVHDALGWLTLVITREGDLDSRQRVECDPACPPVDRGGEAAIPYAVPDADNVFAPPGIEVRNASDETAVVTVAIEHDGDRFFEYGYEATPDRAISTAPVVESEAVYDVIAETDDGRTASYGWNVAGNWPSLQVRLDEAGALRIGCGGPRRIALPVENRDEAARTLRTRLSDGDGVVAESEDVLPAGESTVELAVPMSDEFELALETDGGATSDEYVACYCRSTRAEVTIEDGMPTVETAVAVCD